MADVLIKVKEAVKEYIPVLGVRKPFMLASIFRNNY
jgi:hypothetical protein